MLKDISVFLILLLLVGCSINVEDSTRTISSSTSASGVNGLKVSGDILSGGNINITGDSATDSIVLSAEINQMVLQNEAPANVEIYLQDLKSGNRKVAFKTNDNSWQGISFGKIIGTLPPKISLDLNSASGDITVKNMKSSVFADAASGDVDIKTEGVVDVDASSGNVYIETEKSCNVDVSSGDAYIKSIDMVTVDAMSGDVEVETVKGCNIEALSGDVKVTIFNDSVIFNEIDINSASGDVTVYLPDDFDAWLDIETSSGEISLKNTEVGDSYNGDINNGEVGERVIKIRCLSGDVVITGF